MSTLTFRFRRFPLTSAWRTPVRMRWPEAFLLAAVISVLGVLLFSTECLSQPQGEAPQAGPEAAKAAPPEQTYAPVGPSGYRVPIPEIKMQRIITGPGVHRTEPGKGTADVAPAEKQPPKEQPPPQRTEELQKGDESKVERLPFEPTQRRPPLESRSDVSSRETPPAMEQRGPLFGVPTAPEDVMEVHPPKREKLKKKATPKIPALLHSQPEKGTITTFALTPHRLGPLPQEEWIPLAPRGDMEVIPLPEPAHTPEPGPKPESPRETEPRPGLPTIQVGPGERPLEHVPPPPTQEQIPVHPPVEDVLVTPLTEDTLGDREAGHYLKSAAPILEELSLLMTRVPSLKIEDFDPSKTDVPFVPEDVFLKLDSAKRMLQVLDSKAFAIIPPARYAGFHSMVRESITETLHACEAIISFFHNGEDEDLAKVRQHILKAKELFQKTRKKTG